MQKVRLNGIQLPITQLSPNQLQTRCWRLYWHRFGRSWVIGSWSPFSRTFDMFQYFCNNLLYQAIKINRYSVELVQFMLLCSMLLTSSLDEHNERCLVVTHTPNIGNLKAQQCMPLNTSMQDGKEFYDKNSRPAIFNSMVKSKGRWLIHHVLRKSVPCCHKPNGEGWTASVQ